MMKRRTKFGVIGLIAALMASAALNVFFYRTANEYYLQLNEVRLDPLGLSTYAADALRPSSADEKPLIVFFGDSRAAQWPSSTQITRVTFVNLGIGSQTTAQVLGRFAQQVAPLKPRIIVLQVGINDLKTIPLFPDRAAQIIINCKTNIQKIVELALAGGAQVILTTIFPLGQLPVERRLFWSSDVAVAIESVNDFIKSLANSRVMILDTRAVLANERHLVNPKYSQDFLHLNAEGYAALNQKLEAALLIQLSTE